MVRNWIPAGLSLFLTVACTAAGGAAPPGYVEGHLKIVAPKEVELSGGQTPSIAPEVYAEYPLIIRSSDGKTEVARVTADEHAAASAAPSLEAAPVPQQVYDQPISHIR